MINDKKILVVVPARGGSKGVKLKNIRTVGGIPITGLVGKVVSKLPFVDKAVVSTDHEEIAKIAEEYGIEAPFRRPESIAGDRIGDIDVLTHALEEVEKKEGSSFDIVVMLQPTSPLRKPIHVEETVRKLIEGNFDSVWTVSETDSKAHPYKQLTAEDEHLDYYDKENAPRIIARQQLSTLYHRNGVAYALTRECLLEQKNLFGKKRGYVIIKEPMISIDTEFDFELSELFFKKQFPKGIV